MDRRPLGRGVIVRSMLGLGDNIYQRAFIQEIPRAVYLDTPWPEIYEDLPHVRFVRRETSLRTQAKNAARAADKYVYHNVRMAGAIRVSHVHGGPFQDMAEAFNRPLPKTMTLPEYAPYSENIKRPLAVVRPVTVRKEWYNASRNCLPGYIYQASIMLKQEGYHVVSVADLQQSEEWPVNPDMMPVADEKLHNGELDTKTLLRLIQNADIVVGPVGWIVPACLAYKTKSIIVSGGQGGFNHPDMIAPEPYRAEARMTFLTPDNICMCKEKRHECDKAITEYAEKFRACMVS